jgi:hypothetical protein
MGHNPVIAEKVNGYGYHHISVHYARGWFGKLNTVPADTQHLGNIRLEATAGVDASKAVEIAAADSAKGRATRLVQWLVKTHPQGRWEQFLTAGGKELDWTKVVVGGSSHGATSSARFAMHQQVARVIMFCGPRDNTEDWQAGPSATPKNRFFGYSHVLDGGWTDQHYQRSWLMLGLNEFGPIVNAEKEKAPYGHTRRLIADAPMKGDAKKQAGAAHGYVTPSNGSPKDAQGRHLQEDVWKSVLHLRRRSHGQARAGRSGHPDEPAPGSQGEEVQADAGTACPRRVFGCWMVAFTVAIAHRPRHPLPGHGRRLPPGVRHRQGHRQGPDRLQGPRPARLFQG